LARKLLTGKNPPAGEKAADRRKSWQPAKKLPTGENTPADWQESC
jgi:hypothetical protein